MSDEFDDAEDEEEFEEGDGEGGEDDDSPPKSGFGLKKLLLFVILPLVVLLGGGIGAAWFFGVFDSLFGEAEELVAEGEEAGGPGYFYEMDEILVSMGATGRKSSFLKMRISLELEKKADEVRIKAVLPRIIDNFQVFLRGLRIEELQGSHGLYRVKEELLARVNAAAHPAKVKDVLFKEMLVQ
jgi:flagellar FliL protein